MQLEERVVGEVTILRLSGRMTRDEEYGVLTEKVRTLVHQGERRLVLNLAGVSYMNSTCIGEIVTSLVSVTNRGGTLNLVGPPAAHHAAPEDGRAAVAVRCVRCVRL